MRHKRHRLKSMAILMFVLVLITAMLPVSTQEVQAAKKAKTYKITYKLNGGTNNRNNVKTLKKGKSFTLKKPERTGYTFKGWYTSKNLKKGKITKIKKIKKNTTVYAKWQKNVASKKNTSSSSNTASSTGSSSSNDMLTIQYNLNGGKNPAGQPTQVKKNAVIEVKAATRDGYEFVSWYYDAALTKSAGGGIGKWYAKGYGNGHILYAKWNPKAGTEEPAKPVIPGHSHNYVTPVTGTIHVSETITSCCGVLIQANASVGNISIFDRTLAEKSAKTLCSELFGAPDRCCPKCGTDDFDTVHPPDNMVQNVIVGYECSCGDIQYRNDWNFINEGYSCPDHPIWYWSWNH